jgi:hypothetical protein
MLRTERMDMESPQGKLGPTHLHLKKQDLIEHILDVLGVETRADLIERGLRKMSRTDLVNLCSAIKSKLNAEKFTKPTQPFIQDTTCAPAFGD